MEDFLQVIGLIVGIICFVYGVGATIGFYISSEKKLVIKLALMIGGIILSAIIAIAAWLLIQILIMVAIFVALVILAYIVYSIN